MKKLLLALALLLAPSAAFAQCTGVFPAHTFCGNGSGSQALPIPYILNGGSFFSPQHFYADAVNGNDSFDCLSAVPSGLDGPCKTLLHTDIVAMAYWAGGVGPIVSLAAGTYQGHPISGDLWGAAGTGISGQYLTISGVGATTIITDTGGNAFVMDISSGGKVLFTNLEFDIPNNEVGIFAENSGTVVELDPGLTFHGNGAGSVPMHSESTALIESLATNTITFTGTLDDIFANGQLGFSELDPGGTGVLLCSSCTIAGGPTFLLQNGSGVYIGQGWSFSGFGSPSVVAFEGWNNSWIDNEAGIAIPGTTPGIVSSGGRIAGGYTPSIVSSSGCGSSCTTTVVGDARSAIATIVPGGTGITDVGAVTVNFSVQCMLSDLVHLAPYTITLISGNTGWPVGSGGTESSFDTVPAGEIQGTWQTGASTNLTSGGTYRMGFSCNG